MLAREVGLEVELGNVVPESLVPEALRHWMPASSEKGKGGVPKQVGKSAVSGWHEPV